MPHRGHSHALSASHHARMHLSAQQDWIAGLTSSTISSSLPFFTTDAAGPLGRLRLTDKPFACTTDHQIHNPSASVRENSTRLVGREQSFLTTKLCGSERSHDNRRQTQAQRHARVAQQNARVAQQNFLCALGPYRVPCRQAVQGCVGDARCGHSLRLAQGQALGEDGHVLRNGGGGRHSPTTETVPSHPK